MNFTITLAQLRYIVAVDNHRHFAKAAKSCFVTQPSLSLQIQKLEQQLGVVIFDRSQKPIQVTDIGSALIQQAKTILKEAEGLELIVQQQKNSYVGTLKLGVLPTLAPYILPLLTEPLRQNYPNIQLRIQELTTQHILEALAKNELDAGVIATEEDHKDLTETQLFEETFMNYVSAEHPLSHHERLNPEDFDLTDLWLLNEGHCFRDQMLSSCYYSYEEDIRKLNAESKSTQFDCGYIDTLVRMVDHVGGLTMLPQLALLYLTDEQKKYLRPFEEQAPSRIVRLIQKPSFMKQQLLEAFTSTLKDVVREHVSKTYDTFPRTG